MRRGPASAALAIAAAAATACGSIGRGDPLERKPAGLADLEEPPALQVEPDDEAARRALPLGSFTGVVVTDARSTLEEMGGHADGVRVHKVVENSPGDAAGIEEDDLLLEVRTPGGPPLPLRWASEWRKVETETPPGTQLAVVIDRAGAERSARVATAARVRPAAREDAERFREERRVGVVLRTATEVEARDAGLGAGGGAVVVGLSAGSPWRVAGVRFEDRVVAIGGAPVAHPQVVLDAIRDADEAARIALEIVRGGERLALEAPVSRRAQQLTEVSVPLLYSYEDDRGTTEHSVLLGLVRRRATAVAWEWRFLWLFTLRGGDADRLEELPR